MAFGHALEVVVSRDNVNRFTPIGKRRIVKRIFSWFNNYRRLCQNHELTSDSAEKIVKLASIRMLLNKIQTGSNNILKVWIYEKYLKLIEK